MKGGDPELVALDQEERSVHSLAEPTGVLGQSVEHWLQICRGARDDPKDLAGSRLLGERFREIAVAGLQLHEEPRVLDRDHRLVGEGLKQRDLPRAERAYLGSVD